MAGLYMKFDVSSDLGLAQVINMAMNSWNPKVCFFTKHGSWLVFWRCNPPKGHTFPVPLHADELLPMVQAWLDHPDRYDDIEDYDTDGCAEKGWRVVAGDTLGQIEEIPDSYQATFAVCPAWVIYNK